MIDIDKLKSNNWRQCSVFPAKGTDEIADYLQCDKDNLVNGSCWMVFSHSCDINSPSPDETNIEILLLTPIAQKNNSYIHGRHPRIYHLEINDNTTGSKKCFEARIDNRYRIARNFGSIYAPCPNVTISGEDCRNIIQWITYRYIRSAFPDQFNERIRPIKNKLKSILKKKESEILAGLFISISTNDNLPSDREYEVKLLGLVEDSISLNNLEKANRLVKDFAEVISSCNGIDVSHECSKKSDVIFANWERYQRFTDYDYLSYDSTET